MRLTARRAGRVKKIHGVGWTFLCRECRLSCRCATQAEAVEVAFGHCPKVADDGSVAGA